MKKIKTLKSFRVFILGMIIFGSLFAITAYSHFSGKKFLPVPQFFPQHVIDERVNIVATWISEKDGNYKMQFDNNGVCYAYYGYDLLATYTYDISNTTPKCGLNVLVDDAQETSYLQLTDVNDGTEICYEINGVGSNLLSLTTLGSGRLVTFYKF